MRLFDGFERTNRVDTIQHRIHEQLHEQRESHGRAGRNHITQRRAFHFEIQCGHIQRSRQQSADERPRGKPSTTPIMVSTIISRFT